MDTSGKTTCGVCKGVLPIFWRFLGSRIRQKIIALYRFCVILRLIEGQLLMGFSTLVWAPGSCMSSLRSQTLRAELIASSSVRPSLTGCCPFNASSTWSPLSVRYEAQLHTLCSSPSPGPQWCVCFILCWCCVFF